MDQSVDPGSFSVRDVPICLVVNEHGVQWLAVSATKPVERYREDLRTIAFRDALFSGNRDEIIVDQAGIMLAEQSDHPGSPCRLEVGDYSEADVQRGPEAKEIAQLILNPGVGLK